MTKAQAIALILTMNILTAYGQAIIKWRILQESSIPQALDEKFWFYAKFIASPWILSSFLAAFLASLCWIAAISRLDLSYAYPFTVINYILVLLMSALFFHEPLTWNRYIGLLLVIVGLLISSRQ